MADFGNLILTENMKIYRRLRTWIMLGFVVLVPIAVSVLVYFASWDGGHPTNWEMMLNESRILAVLTTIFTVVIAAESVAGEFTWGTIKLLLIRPWSRSSILLSKYISTVLFSVLLSVVGFAVSLLINLAIYGYSDSASGLSSRIGSPWTFMLEFYGLQFVSQLVIVTFGFMMSSAFRSGGLAIGLSIFLLLAGDLISALISMANKAWVKYVMFPHLDLTAYLRDENAYPIPGQPTTLGFSLAVLAAYIIIFNVISWTVFRRRDVAA